MASPVSAGRPVYDRNRFPMQVAPGTCRGCHREITDPRRSTWCSRECHEKWHPKMVEVAVRKRDGMICRLCGLDIGAALREWRKRKPDPTSSDWAERQAWRREKPKEEYDHIVPFSEGGLTVAENMRTLCRECHLKVTREWRAAKAARKGEKECAKQVFCQAVIAEIGG